MDPEILKHMADVANQSQMIAPAIIAAIIGAVGTMAAAQKQQQGQLGAATAQAADDVTGGINMASTLKYDPEKATQANQQSGYNPYTSMGGGSGMDASKLVEAVRGPAPTMGPVANKMQDEVEKADAGANAGTFIQGGRDRTPVATGGPTMDESFAAAEAAGAAAPQYPQPGAGGEGMSFDDKMQMAAMVASLGSTLAGPGAPPPPSAPRGGGINMTPQFMTARRMYG